MKTDLSAFSTEFLQHVLTKSNSLHEFNDAVRVDMLSEYVRRMNEEKFSAVRDRLNEMLRGDCYDYVTAKQIEAILDES